MRLEAFQLTRFQYPRDRIIGDSQVSTEEVNVVAVELIDEGGQRGLGFAQALFVPLPDAAEIERVFAVEIWPDLAGQEPLSVVHRVNRPRGGNQRSPASPP